MVDCQAILRRARSLSGRSPHASETSCGWIGCTRQSWRAALCAIWVVGLGCCGSDGILWREDACYPCSNLVVYNRFIVLSNNIDAKFLDVDVWEGSPTGGDDELYAQRCRLF